MDNIDDTDKLPVDNQKRLRVHLVPMPSGDNPWRTRQDYLNDKKRDNIKFWIMIGGFIISIISATVSYTQMKEARNERITTEKTAVSVHLAEERIKMYQETIKTYLDKNIEGNIKGNIKKIKQ